MALFLFFTSTHLSYAWQSGPSSTGPGKISGKIIDSASGQPVESSGITLKDQLSRKVVGMATSGNDGLFALANIPEGNYYVEVELVGYAAVLKKNILITAEKVAWNLGIIRMAKKGDALQNVTVTASRRLIENRVDKIVYNVEKDLTSQGGVATDALKKIPGVTVDIDGNVELLGNGGIRFLVDGKPSGIFGNSVADALQSIPASQIQSIEVITTPGAKYDAAGTGGIINIILKKTKVEGFNGNVNVTVGTRLENGTMNAGWHKNSFGLNAFFSGNAQLNGNTPNGMDRTSYAHASAGQARLLQDNNTGFSRDAGNAGISADWDISSKDNLSGSLGYSRFYNRNKGNGRQSQLLYDSAGNMLSDVNSLRDADTKTNINSFDNSLAYKRKFKRRKQELSIAYSGSFGQNNTFYNQSQFYQTPDAPFAGAHSLNPGRDNEMDFSIDYTQPLSENAMLESGIKGVFQSITSNATVYTFSPPADKFLEDATQSYTSTYHRRIYAAYLSFGFTLFKYLEMRTGARLEHTTSEAAYSNAPGVAIPSYNNFIPAVVVSHSFGSRGGVKMTWSKRIERPDYRDLNPFMNLGDPHNISTGNPNLQPEIANKWELGYDKTFNNGVNINLLFFYQRNSPDIKNYITYYTAYKIGDSVYNDVTLTTRANISSEVRAGVSIASLVPVGSKVSLRTNVHVYNRRMKNIYAVPAVIDAFGFRTNMNASFQLNRKTTAEVFGNYNLGMRWQGRQASLFSYTFAARRQIAGNKASIGLVAVNPFNQYIHQKSIQETQDFLSHIYRDVPYRSFGISFMYKFGQLKFSKPKEGENYLYSPPTEN